MTDQTQRRAVALRWHDATCPHGEACEDRALHALPTPMSDLVFAAVEDLLVRASCKTYGGDRLLSCSQRSPTVPLGWFIGS